MSIDWDLFWHMGGHGAYVWGGWGLAVLALGAECLLLWRRSLRLPPPPARGAEARPAPGHAAEVGR